MKIKLEIFSFTLIGIVGLILIQSNETLYCICFPKVTWANTKFRQKLKGTVHKIITQQIKTVESFYQVSR